MRVCHKSVTHPFFRYTKINEFFDMQNLGEVFRELLIPNEQKGGLSSNDSHE